MNISESTIDRMLERAKLTAEHAYCPHSRFPVGASVLTEDGEVFTGCNVENASYGLTICAERNAVFQAVAGGYQRILAVVIFTPTEDPSPSCGACRQVIREFGEDVLIISCAKDESRRLVSTLEDLLPNSFSSQVTRPVQEV